MTNNKQNNDNTAYSKDELKLLYALGEALGDLPTDDETQRAWRRMEASHGTLRRRQRTRLIVLTAASAIAAVVIAAILFTWNKPVQPFETPNTFTATELPEAVTRSAASGTIVITTPPATTQPVNLPDGTAVLLGAGSSIEYPQDLGRAATRQVKVTGMARFSVQRNEKAPFTVHMGGMEAKVLGTVFDVKCYPGINRTVTLYKGKVRVETDSGKQNAILHQGQQAVTDGKGRLNVSQADIQSAKSWSNGMFIFDDTRLQDAMNEIGAWHNKSIIFRSKQAADTRIHFTFPRTETIENVLGALREMKAATFIYDGETIEIK